MNEKEKKLLTELGEKIKEKRKELKMSQSDLSEKAGIDRSYISMVERGETNITYLKLVRIGEVLGGRSFNFGNLNNMDNERIIGYSIDENLQSTFEGIIKTFYEKIVKYDFSSDKFDYFYKEKGDNIKREEYFEKSISDKDSLPVKISGLFIGKELYNIKSNLDKRFLQNKDQKIGYVYRSNFHSESRLISNTLDDIKSFKDKCGNDEITFILNARPCYACSLRIKSFNLVQLKNININISNILICRNDLYSTENYELYDKNYLTDFGSSLKTLLDSGMRVFLYELNSKNDKYKGEDNAKAIKIIYSLNNKEEQWKEKFDNLLNNEYFNIEELDYNTFKKIEENKIGENKKEENKND